MAKGFSISMIAPNWAKWKINLVDFILFRMPVLQIGRANKIIAKYGHLKNKEFAEAACEHIGIGVDFTGAENIPKSGPVTIVSNHPGGADVLATIVALSAGRRDISILANKLICIEPVKEIVIPVNPLAKKKIDFKDIHDAYKAERVVVFYAAGMNSRYNEEGILRDRKWRTTFLNFAKEYNTPINILKIDGKNSPLFYKVSKIRKKYKFLAKVPLENFFQMRELLMKTTMKLYISKPILPTSNTSRQSLRTEADEMYDFLYEMNENNLDIKQKK